MQSCRILPLYSTGDHPIGVESLFLHSPEDSRTSSGKPPTQEGPVMQQKASFLSKFQRALETAAFGLFAILWTASFSGCQSVPTSSTGTTEKPGPPPPSDTMTVRYGTPPPSDSIGTLYGIPTPVDTMVVRYGVQVPIDTFIAWYGAPTPTPTNVVVAKYGVQAPPPGDAVIARYGSPSATFPSDQENPSK